MAEDITKILSAYDITPIHFKSFTNLLYYIDAGKNEYALKKSKLSKESVRMWKQVYDVAHDHHLSFVLPLMLTREGDLFVTYNDNIYYVTPWINQENYSIHKMYRSLGQLHANTKHTYIANIEQIKNYFTTYKEMCQQTLKEVFNAVHEYERQTYMSPFELQVCTHYRHIEHVIKTSISLIDRFLDECQDNSEWSYSLCHGHLRMDHILASDDTYFINWEQAYFDNAIVDLAAFFKEMKLFSLPRKSFISNFSVYLDENKLVASEHLLLCIYLLDPSSYVTIIQQYNDKDHQDTMINHVIALEQAYRQLIFGLQWFDHYEREQDTIIDESTN